MAGEAGRDRPGVRVAVLGRRLAASLFILHVGAAPAQALDARFAGNWRIESASLAPWAEAKDVDPKEARGLIGKRLSFGPKAVSGPAPLGCKGPSYAIHEDVPEGLFEGMLAAPDKAGKPRDAAALARDIGMTTPRVSTLSVGCSEIPFHALMPGTLVFALDNQIYTLERIGK